MSTKELINSVKEVVQFESGVFIAIKKELDVDWDYDCLPTTEDEEGIRACQVVCVNFVEKVRAD